jgi:PAS domain S-box-containing protein
MCAGAVAPGERVRGQSQVLDSSRIEVPHDAAGNGRLRPSWAAIGLFAVVGAAYFLATRVGLALLTTSDGVAAFWPAAGIAAGTIVALGPIARAPVAAGVMAATILASLTGDRIALPAAIVFAMCNAGEALLVAWLIERHHGPGFSLDSFPRVIGFFLATGLSTAASAVAASAAFALFHITDAPVVTTWLHWLASDAFGIVTMAPLVIGIVRSLQDPPHLAQVAEGACILTVLAVASVFCFGWPTSNWFTILPLAMLLPLFIWPAARCPPVFAAAAVFILAVVVVASVTFGVGRLADAAVPLSDRLVAAQSALMAISACALVVAALFAERRSREALLSASNERLRAQEGSFRRLLGALPAAIYTTDRAGYLTYCNQAAAELWGRRPELGKDKWSDLWRLHYPDGTSMPLDERPTQIVLNEGRAVRGREALLERPNGTLVPIMPCPAPLIDERGAVIGVVNMQIDITERKRTEAVLKESESCLADALTAGQVIAFEWDAATRRSRRSANAALILGFEEVDGDPGLRCDNFFPHVHPDDRGLFKARMRDLRPDHPSYALTFRFRSPDGRQVWLEETAKGEFDRAGRLLRIKGLTRNITDRKKAELALDERNMQLALAAKTALVGSFALDFETDEVQVSEGFAALHGFPEGTRHTTRSIWKAGVHPEDLCRLEELRSRAFRERRHEYAFEYRTVRPAGEVRWIEARCFALYGGDGRPRRVVGVDIDVTARKRAEEHQRMLVAELDHRVKNVLATVSAVASRAQDASLSGADFAATLAGRIQSMAATHELLSCRQWKGVSVRELVRRELAPYVTRRNTELDGPELTLCPEAAQAVSMVLHELTTNAGKHGALSTDDGRVSVRWGKVMNGSPDARIRIEWQEAAGPTVRAPRRSGYGMEVIRDLIPYELGGAVDLTFSPDGVRCQIDIPVAGLLHERPLSLPVHSTANTLASSETS